MRILKTAALSVATLAFCLVGLATAQSIQITSGPTAQNVTSNSAVITWDTSVNSSTKVLYGTDQNVLQQQINTSWGNQNRAPSSEQPGVAEQPWGGTHHSVQLTNLQPGTTYYYAVRSSGAQGSGAATTSNMLSFTTQGSTSAGNSSGQPLAITSGPVLQNVTPNSATVNWTTNASGSTMVMYGTDLNTLQTQAAQAWPQQNVPINGPNPGFSEQPWGGTTHTATLTGLQPNTTYYYMVRSTAGLNTGTSAASNIFSFVTPQ